MASQVDVTKPVYGSPTTQSVRDNFNIVGNEITALQNAIKTGPYLPLAGGTLTGPMYLHNDPTDPRMPATKAYVDAGGAGGGGGLTEAPADGTLYARQDGAWEHAVDTAELNTAIAAATAGMSGSYLPIAGGTLTGDLIVQKTTPSISLIDSSATHYVYMDFSSTGVGTDFDVRMAVDGGVSGVNGQGNFTVNAKSIGLAVGSGQNVAIAGGGLTVAGEINSGPYYLRSGRAYLTDQVTFDTPAAAFKVIQWNTNNKARWLVGVDNAAEGGSGAGSNWFVNRYDDAGGFLGAPINITRSTGLIRLNNRTLINQPTDDTTSALLVNGIIKSIGDNIAGGSSVGQTVVCNGNLGGNFTMPSGGFGAFGWNYQSGTGEISFFNSYAAVGGYRWWQRNTANTGWNNILILDQVGNLTCVAMVVAQNFQVNQAAGKIWLENTRARTLRWTVNNGSGVSGLQYTLNDGTSEMFYMNDYGDLRVTNGVYAANGRTSTFGMWFDGSNYIHGWGNVAGAWIDWFEVANGDRHWRGASADLMLLTGGGNLRVYGNVYASNTFEFGLSTSADGLYRYTLLNPNCYHYYSTAAGNFGWVVNTITTMSIGGNGNLSVKGDGYFTNVLTAYNGVFAVQDNTFGIQQNGTNRMFHWMSNWYDMFDTNTGQRHWWCYDKWGMYLNGGGDLTVYNSVVTKYIAGGAFNAGTLNCINGTATVCFNWADRGGTWLASYRMSETNDMVIPLATNASEFSYVPGGGPIGVHLNGYSFGRTLYGVYVDVSSDERIKHSIAPTKVDALEAIRNIQVSEFFIYAAARAALSPVSLYDKPKVKALGDAYIPIGIVAQQAQPFIPEMVYATKQNEDRFDKEAIPDDLHSLTMQASVPYLIRAIQQLLERIEILEGNAPTSKGLH